MTAKTNRARDAKGQPTGGQFAAQTRPESDKGLPATEPRLHGAIAGVQVLNYRNTGQGMEGRGYAVDIHIDGAHTLTLTNPGNGGASRIATLDGMNAESTPAMTDLTNRARKVMDDPTGNYAVDEFLHIVHFRGECENLGREFGEDPNITVEENLAEMGDTASERYKAILRDPDAFSTPEFLGAEADAANKCATCKGVFPTEVTDASGNCPDCAFWAREVRLVFNR